MAATNVPTPSRPDTPSARPTGGDPPGWEPDGMPEVREYADTTSAPRDTTTAATNPVRVRSPISRTATANCAAVTPIARIATAGRPARAMPACTAALPTSPATRT